MRKIRTSQELGRHIKKSLTAKDDTISGFVGRISDNVCRVAGKKNYTYVTLSSGIVIEARNRFTPPALGMAVLLRPIKNDPTQFEIYDIRPSYSRDVDFVLLQNHAENHDWTKPDETRTHLRQFLPLRVMPAAAGGVAVDIDAGWYETAAGGTAKYLGITSLSLAAYTPTTGARWLLIQLNRSGVLVYSVSATKTVGSLLNTDIPHRTRGFIALAAIRLYPAQTSIRDTINNPDLIDLRFSIGSENWPLDQDIKRQGMLNDTETSISFDGTNAFTLTDAGAGWSYYRLGVKHTVTGNKTVNLVAPASAPAPAGDYHIYIDAVDGTLTCDTTGWDLLDSKVPVAVIVWNNALTPKFHLSDERHTVLIDWRMQYYLHFVDGAHLQTFPTLSGQTVNTDTNAAKTCGISECVLLDQDKIHVLAALSDPDGTTDSYSLWYRTAASVWAWKYSKMPFAYNGATNAIQWDNAGTLTDASSFGPGANTRWINSYLVVSNKTGMARHIFVPGRAEFLSLTAAQAEDVAGFNWAGFEVDEAVTAYQFTWTTATATSLGKCMLAVLPRIVNLTATTTVTATTDHNSLAGLNTGDYQHLTAAELSKLGGITAGAQVNQRIMTANVTLANGECWILSGYLDLATLTLTLNGDSRLEII